MNPLLPVLPLPRSGSSGAGISYYTQIIRCPRKVVLDRELKEPDDRADGAAAVGTMVHQLDELYYGGRSDNPLVIPISDVNWGNSIDEAKRCWGAYIKRFPGRDWWGEVLAVELRFPIDAAGFEQEQLEQAALIAAAVGIDPFTIRIDRVIQVTKESALRIATNTELGALKPGVYLYDRKTKGKADGDAALMHAHSLQFYAYMMVYNAINQHEPCLGLVVDEIVTTKEPKFRQFLVTPPDERQQQVVRSMLKNAKALEKSDAALGVAFGCKEYNRFCPHLLSGACTRS